MSTTTTSPESSAADSAANPALVREAFVSMEPIRVGDLPLHPLSIGTCLLLEELDSPLVAVTPGRPVKLIDLAVAAFVLTRDEPVIEAILSRGREHFDRAVRDLARQIPATELRELGRKLREHLESAFATAIPAGPADQKKTGTEAPASPSSTSAVEAPVSAGR